MEEKSKADKDSEHINSLLTMEETIIRVDDIWKVLNKHPDFTGCLFCNIGNSVFGKKVWYKNGKYHRENGPAIEYIDGDNYWFLNGVGLTEREHRMLVRQIKLKLLDDIVT